MQKNFLKLSSSDIQTFHDQTSIEMVEQLKIPVTGKPSKLSIEDQVFYWLNTVFTSIYGFMRYI
ncbi:hypothetical protein C9426_07720 [Serratia sp. S1B]|nr:hypothetical protein C9426_07720 [Serratia sp. S1B]